MSIDTQLNIAAVVLAGIVAFVVLKNRADIRAARILAQKNHVTIEHLPDDIAPAKETLERVIEKNERVTNLLVEASQWMVEQKAALDEVEKLKRQVDQAAYKLEAKNGEVVHLTDMLQRQIGVSNKQSESIRRLENIVQEQARTIDGQRKLIEEQLNAILNMMAKG